jgi:threonine/homoserine/homoserine lactone efflux protein
MPALETLLAVALAAAVMNALPGPSQLYVVTRTVALGRRAGLASALGLACGAVVHVVLAATGLVALMQAVPLLFDLLRVAGAAYIVWLGIATWFGHDEASGPEAAVAAAHPWRLWRQGFVIEVANPKTALFFLAFLPPFVDPALPLPWLQMIVLGMLVPLTALPVDLSISFAAAAAAGRLGAKAARWRRRIAGGVLMALGGWLLVEDGRG